MTPRAILKLCHVVGQPVSLITSGPCPGPLGAQSHPALGSSRIGRPHHLTVMSVSQPLLGAPTAHPSPRRPWRGGCDVPSVHLSGCRPCHPDTCLTCLTRAMPVASPPCGLCVGRGWGPGLAPSGWTVGAWSWNRPPATGDCQAGSGWDQRGRLPPQAEQGPCRRCASSPQGF